ncbi:MAG: hypothetical protein R3F62_18740 [Planctomycetota bacterium]
MPRLIAALLCASLLLGCSSDPEPAPEPAPERTTKQEAPPTDSPPLSKPRPKLIPGDVVDDEDRRNRSREDED